MNTENTILYIKERISKGEEITPFLFVGKDIERTNKHIEDISRQLMSEYSVDKNYFFILSEPEERSLKIAVVKEFMKLSFSMSPFVFQVFCIQNISRLTPESGNALLKFLEEPGVGNIIFLSNAGDVGVLDTILSRVKVVKVESDQTSSIRSEFLDMIETYAKKRDTALLEHFYNLKVTRDDALDFLRALLEYIKTTLTLTHILEEIDDDITGLERNNLLPKFVVDKYIILISK